MRSGLNESPLLCRSCLVRDEELSFAYLRAGEATR
jgi:hypothetical protein